MNDKLLICVSALQATAACWRRGRITRLEQFAHDENGLEGFRQFLAHYHHVPVYMMVDTIEEDYLTETLPHSSGFDRAQLVQRKLRQHYRNTPYVGGWLQGRERDQRRDDRYLFAALTNPDLPAPWLKVVNAQDLPVAGLHLLPMMSAALISKLQLKASNVLIAAEHADGLRLTFLSERQFRLSRVTRIDRSINPDPAYLYPGEIANMRLYLHALRSVTLDAHLTVLLLDPSDTLHDVAQIVTRDNPSVECMRMDRAALSARLKLDPQFPNSSTDALYIQVLGLHTPFGNIATAAVTTGFRRYRSRRAIHAACVGIGATGALLSGAQMWQASRVDALTTEVAAQVGAQTVQYQRITRALPAAPAAGENLKRVVEMETAIREQAREPMPALSVIAEALMTAPAVTLREVGWKLGLSDIETASGTGTPAAPQKSVVATPGAPPPARHQSAYLNGELKPFNGDYRVAIETIRALVAHLRAHPSVADV
ncbi:MAG: hypothetical protein V4637_16070, partial [Pseudomonadota bacterium]